MTHIPRFPQSCQPLGLVHIEEGEGEVQFSENGSRFLSRIMQ
jgi:hypothetical protein